MVQLCTKYCSDVVHADTEGPRVESENSVPSAQLDFP